MSLTNNLRLYSCKECKETVQRFLSNKMYTSWVGDHRKEVSKNGGLKKLVVNGTIY